MRVAVTLLALLTAAAAAAKPPVSVVDDAVKQRKALLDKVEELGPFEVPEAGVLAFDGTYAGAGPFRIEARVGPAGATPQVATEAGAAVEAWIAAFNDRDLETYLDTYADDPRLHIVEKGRHTYRSRQEIVEAVQGLYDTIESGEIRLLDFEVTALSADLALAVAEFEQDLVFDADNSLRLAGTMQLVLERRPGGWKVLAGDTSSAPRTGS